jgi:hypothetical protein
MRTSDSFTVDTRRIRAVGLCGLAVILAAATLAFALEDIRWLALAVVGSAILAGALFIGYRQRRGPLDWDQHYGEKTESNFHHL